MPSSLLFLYWQGLRYSRLGVLPQACLTLSQSIAFQSGGVTCVALYIASCIAGGGSSNGTGNAELAMARWLLGVAFEWRLINRIPVIRKLDGERSRDFVLSQKQEGRYLESAPQPLHDASCLMLDTGLRVGELEGMERTDVHLEAGTGAKFGYLKIRRGKSKTPDGLLV